MSPDLNLWLQHIEKCHSKEICLGLERVKKVGNEAKVLNMPFPKVMVGGTNGKGSTVSILSMLLKKAGLNVGTYSSPHLLRFNERIQVNGECVKDDELCQSFAYIEKKRANTALTFFEFTTLAAFSVFCQPKYNLDIVILEVGLGGRLDAVNAIEPDLAIITSIGYDHQHYLGDTLEHIALEKAGILRPHIPVVLGTSAKISTLLQKARERENPLYVEGDHFDYEEAQHQWHFQEEVVQLPEVYLPINSVSMALAAYTILAKNDFFHLPKPSLISSSLEKLMMVGRYQQLRLGAVNVILDVGHNGNASLWLAKKLDSVRRGKLIAVWASLRDKSLSEIIIPLKEKVDHWCVGDLMHVERSTRVDELYCKLAEQGISTITKFDSIWAAFKGALKMSEKEDTIFVFGSFYTVSEVLDKLSMKEKEFHNNGLYHYTQGECRWA